jgi:hypothetical protein
MREGISTECNFDSWPLLLEIWHQSGVKCQRRKATVTA